MDKLTEIEERIAALEAEYGDPAQALIQGEPDWAIRNEYEILRAARIKHLFVNGGQL